MYKELNVIKQYECKTPISYFFFTNNNMDLLKYKWHMFDDNPLAGYDYGTFDDYNIQFSNPKNAILPHIKWVGKNKLWLYVKYGISEHEYNPYHTFEYLTKSYSLFELKNDCFKLIHYLDEPKKINNEYDYWHWDYWQYLRNSDIIPQRERFLHKKIIKL